MTKRTLAKVQPIAPALRSAIAMWAESSTDPASARRLDLLRDKTVALLGDGINKRTGKECARGFFVFSPTPLERVTAGDIANWREHLADVGLKSTSVYKRLSSLKVFYDWLMEQPKFKEHIPTNPVLLPKAPKPYQSEGTQSLSDEDARALLRTVQSAARTGDVAAIRDYALLRFYFATGKRRAEIIGLKWGDLRVNGVLTITAKHKGGLYAASEITDPGVKAALFAYLKASGRWNDDTDQPNMAADSPLWLRHDRASKGQQPLTSHGFVKALKGYATAAGIGAIHLHQTRHTVARLVGEESGNMTDVQTVLGHADQRTTEVYLARIAVKKDKYSGAIASRLHIDKDE